MNAVRSALAQGLSWKELGELIKVLAWDVMQQSTGAPAPAESHDEGSLPCFCNLCS